MKLNKNKTWPQLFHLDGNNNIYLANANGQIIIVPSDGSPIKTISWEKTGGMLTVDADGNVYANYNKNGEQPGFILTRPDGTQKVFKNFDLFYEENGIVYDLRNNKALTITDNGDKPEKLPPHLVHSIRYKEKSDLKIISPGIFSIYTGKINKHLKKINRHVDGEKIQIIIKGYATDFIGIDDNADSYFFSWEDLGNINEPWKDADVFVYSKEGKKIGEIPIDLDYFSKQSTLKEIQLDTQGNVFQFWASEDGVHILKWIKN